ncbi:site-2 protease family protein [Beduinella massiliensis]|uniref:site-2 protease family protein n=1 Tax=Beduinella massiliensis TaxID=1852363 RepID=UPI000C85D68C
MDLLKMLRDNPMQFLDFSLYRVPAVLIALCCHEWGHAFVAYLCGDPTAKLMHRMTLNPLRHLDPVGTIMLFFLGFGWAKPVPVNPHNFRNGRWDDLKVSIAGISVNLLIFLGCTLALVGVTYYAWTPEMLRIYSLKSLLGINSGIAANIMMGNSAFFADSMLHPGALPVLRMLMQIAHINLYIALFNLVPVPPLDGYHVLNDLVLRGRWQITQRQAQIGIGVVLAVSFMTNWLSIALNFAATGIQNFILRFFM